MRLQLPAIFIFLLQVDLQSYMDKKHKAIKQTLKKPNEFLQEKGKKLRTITGRSPKPQETFTEKKGVDHEKSKINSIGLQRAMTKSVVPLQSPLGSGDREFNKLKLFQSNFSCAELPLSLSEKTIKFVKSIQKKLNPKLTKGKKKTKPNKVQKQEEVIKAQEKCGITRRKVAQTKDDYEILYLKTEKILKEYQERENEWQRQKNMLMEQLQDFRRKSMGMALTNCSTLSINRRHFF